METPRDTNSKTDDRIHSVGIGRLQVQGTSGMFVTSQNSDPQGSLDEYEYKVKAYIGTYLYYLTSMI